MNIFHRHKNISWVYVVLFGTIGLIFIFTASRFSDSEFLSTATFNVWGKKIEPGGNALNTAYVIDGSTFALVNGQATEPIKEKSEVKVKLSVWGSPIAGDLNADGKMDSAVVLTYFSPSAKNEYYLAAAVKGIDGKYTSTKTIYLGDKITMQEVTIVNGTINVSYLNRVVSEPITAEPKSLVSRKFKLLNNILITTK